MFADQLKLDDRVALITGSGRGIGLAIGEALAENGAAVVLHDIDLDVAQAAAERIKKRGGRAIAFGGDINDLTLPDRLVAESERAFGGLHILINNASIQSHGSWLDVGLDVLQRELNADLISPILFCQSAAKIFRKQRFGRIINLGSIQQLKGNGQMLPYSLSKSTLVTLTRVLARELAEDSVTVNLIAPGWINTFRTKDDFPDEETIKEKGQNSIPLGRIGEGVDCAGLALLLCSDAGEYITGQSIYVDGGLSVK